MRIDRRDFIKIGSKSLLGGIIVYGGLPTLLRGPQAPPVGQEAGLDDTISRWHYWRFIVDIKKCIGCGRCVEACRLENDVPLDSGYGRTWVERYVVTESEEVLVDSPKAGIDGFASGSALSEYKGSKVRKSFFVPKLCNHCDKPPCVPVCPVRATYVNQEGVVLVNRRACIGCRYCIQACPYGARFFDSRLRIVDKCTWCYHRITKGIAPACVEVCPVGARVFGDMRDGAGLVSKIINEEVIGILKPEIGCGNKVYYIGLEKGVR